MNTFEKTYSIFAIIFAISLIILLTTLPELREIQLLIPAISVGLFVNVVLMFMVFRDIFFRRLPGKNGKLFWTMLLLLFWPATLVYLPLHGFRIRTEPHFREK